MGIARGHYMVYRGSKIRVDLLNLPDPRPSRSFDERNMNMR